MHIAYLTGEYPRATDTFIQREVAALRERGISVETISIRQPKASENVSPQQEVERQQTFYVLPCSPVRLIHAQLRFLLSHPKQYFKTIRLAWSTRQTGLRGMAYQLFYLLEAAVVADLLSRRGVTHLHNHFANSSCSVSMLASSLSSVPFSFTLHGPAIFFEPHRWRLDEKIRHARFVACISHYCRSQAMIFSKPKDWAKLHIVHCGVEPSHYTVRSHQGIARQLLFVGRLARVKGLPILLEAVAVLKQKQLMLNLTIIGDGPDRVSLEQQTNALGLNDQIHFAGYQSPQAVCQQLAQTDIFVLPSFAEGVPVVLMEALASGVPAVATQIAGVSELIDPGQNSLLVPPGDMEALAHNIETLAHDPDLRTRMGQAGCEKVQHAFHQTQEAAWICDLFESTNTGQRAGLRPIESEHTYDTPVNTENAPSALSLEKP